MGYSTDLRERVVDFVKNGGSKTEAAKQFSVSRAIVYICGSKRKVCVLKKQVPKDIPNCNWKN